MREKDNQSNQYPKGTKKQGKRKIKLNLKKELEQLKANLLLLKRIKNPAKKLNIIEKQNLQVRTKS